MAINTRNCFWFGTEERADWFATPLAGADSSPSAWGADGTLLNGGGWALNSWGSHKRYTYEWPASSSRETAQRMKSYRDGTYGRGLLYFLEPTIFTTNVLPAHWADPSMSLDNEAPSLVYGVDPTPVATSGGANLGLPITSARYDLSNTAPQSIPTPDSSVFIPIPEGHTLFLGAFYSSTGTGGVFATPVNGNGTLGTAVKLTEKTNSDTDVVTDRFSGDLRGVRLWVGRSDSTSSTVTIAAMAGRLIETSQIPVYSPWTEQRRNVAPNPRVIGLTGYFAGYGTGGAGTFTNPNGALPARMGGGSGPLARMIWTTAPTAGVSRIILTTLAAAPGEVVTVQVSSRFGATNRQRLIVEFYNGETWLSATTGDYRPGVAGVWDDHAVVTTPAPALTTAVRAYVRLENLPVVDKGFDVVGLQVEKSSTAQPYFDGSTPAPDTLIRYLWTGAANASESVMETRTMQGNPAKENLLKSGPWVGGQGHSGCRFLGTPSYVTNSPIEGGRIGFAASFVEVGSWIYG